MPEHDQLGPEERGLPESGHEASTPERRPDEMSQSVWEEVQAANEVIRPVTLRLGGEDPPPLVDSWQSSNPREAALAAGFRRGRQVMQGVTYGHSYWEMENGLDITLDDTAMSSKHEGVKLGTKRLLQLVILSRAPLKPVEGDEHWHLPDPQDIRKIEQEVREELGVAEEYKKIWEGENPPMYPPDFPGVDDTAIVDAIISGRLRVGRPGEPDAQYWRP